ncbi:MAG: 6-carboxytetrahydropterin synthase, partial [Pirellulaceae bacterium]
MFRVSREIDFCYGHRLLNYDGKCRYLHGHNGRAIITIESAALDERGMVMDFTDIKRFVSSWIDENLDHRMLLCKDDPYVAMLKDLGEPLFLM